MSRHLYGHTEFGDLKSHGGCIKWLLGVTVEGGGSLEETRS